MTLTSRLNKLIQYTVAFVSDIQYHNYFKNFLPQIAMEKINTHSYQGFVNYSKKIYHK